MLLLVDWHGFGDNISANNLSAVSKIDLGGDLENILIYIPKKIRGRSFANFYFEFLNLIYKNIKIQPGFLGQNFYIYSNGIIANKADLDLMLEFARVISEKIGAKLPVMQGQ